MNYLLIDDTPGHLKPLIETLREAGHTVAIARDLGIAWAWLQRGDRFDLIAIDLALDRFIGEFRPEQNVISEGLASRGLGDLPMSGQALGLRLWRQREELKQRYFYITNHMHLWVEAVDKKDPEFGGKLISEVVLDKSGLFSKNIIEKFNNACLAWDNQRWLDYTG